MKGLISRLDIPYDRNKAMHNILFAGITLLLSLVCLSALPRIGDCTHTYPLDTTWKYGSQYELQFSAFLHGQIPLEEKPGEGLAKCENPYDPDIRERDGIETSAKKSENTYLWDIAYYNGNYYSYFGIAPILTVFYPVFAVTGAIPTREFVCVILGMLAVVFTALAYREVVLRFCRGANLWLMLAGLVAVIFASGAYADISYGSNYYIAVLSALECSMAFIFLSFRAMRARRVWLRSLLLGLSAIALTLTVWSRPTTVIMCLMVIPLFLSFAIRIKRKTLCGDLISIASFVVVLAGGAAAVMWYNYVRFDSPFEFGSIYQLTVNDISKNTITLSFLKASVLSYFLQAPAPSSRFPFVKESFWMPVETSRYLYCHGTVGMFYFGLPLGMVLSPAFCKLRRDRVKSATYIAVIVLALVTAFVNFCLAGVCTRYIYDILPVLSLMGAVVLLELYKHTRGRGKAAAAILFLGLCLLAVLMTVGVIRSNENDLMFGLSHI